MEQISINNWENCEVQRIAYARENPFWKYPITIDPIKELFDEAYKTPSKSSDLYCAKIENVCVMNGKILSSDLTREVKEFSRCGDFQESINEKRVNNAIHLVDRWGGTNYWHWMSTCLAKMRLANELPNDVYYIINSYKNEFVKGSLLAAEIDLNQCIEIDRCGTVFCTQLIAPSPVGDRDKDNFIFLRDSFRKPVDRPNERILISRSGTRRIKNENDVVNCLSRYGFKKYRCEELSFNEQIDLFSNAECIIAPHGAGLTNVIFAPDDAKILELRSPKYFGSCYWKLCNHLSLDYYSLYGEGDLPKNIPDLSKDLNANMTVNIEKLEKTIAIMSVR